MGKSSLKIPDGSRVGAYRQLIRLSFTQNYNIIDIITQNIPDLEARNGSMWIFKMVLTLDLHVGGYQPLKGSSYVPLPEKLKLKNAINNVQNDDNACFKWAILSALHPPSSKPYRVSKY